MKKISIHIILSLLLCSCIDNRQGEQNSSIYVSIVPLASLVERITCEDFEVKVVVPSGSSVESYELTPQKLIDINNSQLILSTGLLEFERAILGRISAKERVVDLSQGVELIEGSCNHNHHNHSHGVDPHTWTSPRELRVMASNCYDAVAKLYPDSAKYREAYLKLDEELTELDRECRAKVSTSGVKSIFIYHPALTYYARAYGVEQVSIESDGKEPSAKHLSEIIKRGRSEGIERVLYQVEYPRSSVEIVASDIGAEAVVIDPLSVDIILHIQYITDIITSRR